MLGLGPASGQAGPPGLACCLRPGRRPPLRKPVEFSNGCGRRDGHLWREFQLQKMEKTMKNMGSDLSDLSFKCFCDPDEVFGPVWWSTNIRTFWRNFLRLQPTKMVIEPTRDGMKWGTSSKKCDVKPLSSCLVVWDIYMCLPTCIYMYVSTCT